MIPRKAAPFLALGLVIVGLAGCVAESDRSFTVPQDAGPVAKQSDVEEPHRVQVTVTRESPEGTRLPGAAVVFVGGSGASVSGGGSVDVSTSAEAGPGRGQTSASVNVDTSTEATGETLATGRTATNGTVTGLLSPNQTVDIVVGDATGFTTELRANVLVGDAGETTRLTVPLYHEQLNFEGNATMPTTASARDATLGQTERGRHAVPVPFAEADAVQAAYMERLVSASVAISWTNEPPTHADLYAGWGAGEELLEAGEDERQMPAGGEVVETLTVDKETVYNHQDALSNAGSMTVFALTDNVAASPPDGVPFQVNGTASFQGTGHGFSING